MTAFNHREAQRNKPRRIARRLRVSFGQRPASWGAKLHTKKVAKA